MPTVYATTRDQPPPADNRAIPYPFILNSVEGWTDKEWPVAERTEQCPLFSPPPVTSRR